MKITFAGAPSALGGADTELRDTILLFEKYGLEYEVVSNEAYKKGDYRGKVVASFCNGGFLDRIFDDPPARVFWFNCMTWTFPKELQALKDGLITDVVFQSAYQRDILLPQFNETGSDMRVWACPSYVSAHRFRNSRSSHPYFGVGRISRPDPDKFAPDTWDIYFRIASLLPKAFYIMGVSEAVLAKIGPPKDAECVTLYPPNAMPTEVFFRLIDITIQKNCCARESYGRTMVEAMFSGVVPLVQSDFAYPELLGKGGPELGKLLLCSSSDEFVERATMLGSQPKLLEWAKDKCVAYAVSHFGEEAPLSFWQTVSRC